MVLIRRQLPRKTGAFLLCLRLQTNAMEAPELTATAATSTTVTHGTATTVFVVFKSDPVDRNIHVLCMCELEFYAIQTIRETFFAHLLYTLRLAQTALHT